MVTLSSNGDKKAATFFRRRQRLALIIEGAMKGANYIIDNYDHSIKIMFNQKILPFHIGKRKLVGYI